MKISKKCHSGIKQSWFNRDLSQTDLKTPTQLVCFCREQDDAGLPAATSRVIWLIWEKVCRGERAALQERNRIRERAESALLLRPGTT